MYPQSDIPLYLLGKLIRSITYSTLLLCSFSLAAKSLTVYTYDAFASQYGPGPQVQQAFEKTCRCRLSFVALDSSAEILSRIQLEGNNSKADIMLGIDTNLMKSATATGLFAEHGMQVEGLDLPFRWVDPTFIPFDYGYFAFIYDSEKMQDPPKSFSALLASPYRLIIQDPRSSTPGMGLLLWIKSIYGDSAGDYWRSLKPKLVTVTKGWAEAYGMFLQGESDMVLSYTTSPAYHVLINEEYKYKAAAFDEGHYLQIEVAARLRNSPEPELADQFLSFMLSAEFQSLIPTGNWMYPVKRDAVLLPAAFSNLYKPKKALQLDHNEISQYKKEWLTEFITALRE